MTKSQSHWTLFLSTLMLLLAFYLRVWHLEQASLWIDEIFTFHRVSSSLAHTLQETLRTNTHVPLYFLSLHLLPHFAELPLRYSGALEGVLGVALFILLVRRFYRSTSLALAGGLLLATNPYHIWLSRMARPYPMLLVFTLLASYFFLLLLKRSRTRLVWAGFIVSSAAAYMTHVFGLMLPLAQYVVFAFELKKSPKLFRGWIGAQLVAGLPLLGWLIAALLQWKKSSVNIGWIPTPRVQDLLGTVENMAAGYEGALRWYILPSILITLATLTIGIVVSLRSFRREPVAVYWVILIIAPLGVSFAVSQVRPLYIDRYFVEILPALLLLILTGLWKLPRQSWRNILLALLLLSNAATVMAGLADHAHEHEAWQSAANIVQQNYRDGDGLLVQRPVVLRAFTYYFGQQALAAVPVFGVTDPNQGIYWGGPVLPGAVQRLWVIYDVADHAHQLGPMPPSDPFAPTQAPLSPWVAEHRDQILERHDLHGMTLLLVDVQQEKIERSPILPDAGMAE